MKIEFRKTKDTASKTVDVPFEMNMLSDADVHELARRAAVVAIQARLRNMKAKDKVADINWLKVARPRVPVSIVDKALDVLAKLSDEERAAIIEQAKKMKGANK